MKIKKKASDMVIGLVYFLASLAISMVSFSTGELELVHRISNSYFTDYAMIVDGSDITLIDYSEDLLRGNALFYKEEHGIYSVFFTGHFNIPVISGRFFSPRDFEDGLPKVVVGRDIQTNKAKDGKTYYTYGNINYEVIGIAGIKKISGLDNSVYLSMPPHSINTKKGPFIIDGTKVVENIRILRDKHNLSSSKLENLGVQRIFESKGSSYQGLFRTIGLVFLTSILAITSYWFLQKHKLVLILKICGISRLKIIGVLCMEYVRYALLSFVVGTAFSLLFIKPLFSYPFNIASHFAYISAGILFCLVPSVILNLQWANQTMGRYQR